MFSEELGIVIVDHGSEFPDANDLLVEVVRLFKETTGAVNVEPAHMELAPPTIEEALARCVARGARRVVVHPYFLAPGRHSTSDIPRLAQKAAVKFSGVRVSVTQPLGLDECLAGLIRRRISAALAENECASL